MEDPFGYLELDCPISSSQQQSLPLRPFAREDEFPPPSAGDNGWPELSSSGELPNDVVGITICSAPETPELEHEEYSTSPQAEEFKTPPEVAATSQGDVVSGNDEILDLGFSGERRRSFKRKRKEEKACEPVKKLKDSDVVLLQKPEIGGDTEVLLDVDDDLNSNSTSNSKSESKLESNSTSKSKSKLESNSTSKSESKLESNSTENAMKCLMDVLRAIATDGGSDDYQNDTNVDIFETAMRRGMTFPRPRGYDRD